jgi:hypothetical protein
VPLSSSPTLSGDPASRIGEGDHREGGQARVRQRRVRQERERRTSEGRGGQDRGDRQDGRIRKDRKGRQASWEENGQASWDGE